MTHDRTPDQIARDTEQIAIKLRQVAFPGASDWSFCGMDVRGRWIKAAIVVESMVVRVRDRVLRDATANAHALGQHAAAKMLREMRFGPDATQSEPETAHE